MNSAKKNNLKLKMNLAHCIAKQLGGNYSARMSFALKLINNSSNTYGFNSNIHAYGVNRYWPNIAAFNALSNAAISFVENEMVEEPKKAAIWWSKLSETVKSGMMVKGLFGRNFRSLNEIEIKHLYRCRK